MEVRVIMEFSSEMTAIMHFIFSIAYISEDRNNHAFKDKKAFLLELLKDHLLIFFLFPVFV